MADIEFTSEIKLDTDKALKSVVSLASQVKHIFEDTSRMMSSAIRTKNFGFSGIKDSYAEGLREAQTILGDYAVRYATQKEKPKNFYEAAKYVSNIKRLSGLINNLSPYDNLYANIDELKGNIAAGKIRSKSALRRYGVLQNFSNKALKQYYRGYVMFPEIFNEAALGYAEGWRDLNRINGIEARAAERFLQKEDYKDKSTERAISYLWYKGGLRELNDEFGLGITPKYKRSPAKKLIDPIELNKNYQWVSAGFQASALRNELASGDLSPQDFKTYRSEYMKAMNKLIKGFEKAYPEQHSIALALRRIQNEFGATPPGGGQPSLWQGLVSGGLLTMLAKNVIGSALDIGDTLIETYGNEKIQRNAYYSEKAHRERLKAYAKGVGSVGGAVVGGVAGGLIGGAISLPAGGSAAIPGALGGAAAGSWFFGRVAGMYPEWYKKEFESDIRSSTEIAAMARNHSLYGYSYNTFFEHGLTEQGIANGAAAMGGLADRSMNMRARMMLGQVSEQEMLYMSMMPNYYAALMGGVTGPELLNIYHRDLQSIGDPSMKYLVGHAIGNTEAFAAANSRYFSSFYNQNYAASSAYKRNTDALEASFMTARGNMAIETLGLENKEIQDTYRRGNPMITVVVNIDGEEIKRASGQDEVYMNDLQLYTVGG